MEDWVRVNGRRDKAVLTVDLLDDPQLVEEAAHKLSGVLTAAMVEKLIVHLGRVQQTKTLV